MSGSFPSLGFDPAPGDVFIAGGVTRSVAETARALEEMSALLGGAADGEWRGEAAIAFRDVLSDDLRPKVETAGRSFEAAWRALDDWLDTMRTSQRRARYLEERHAGAVRRARSASASYAGIPGPVPFPGDALTPEEARAEAERARALATAGRALATADAEVDRIHGEARELLHRYEDLGRQAATRLQHAMDIAPDEPGFWQGLLDGVGTVLAEIGEWAGDVRDEVLELLERLSPLLDLLGDLAGMLSAVCGLLAWVPALQFLAAPAVLLGLAAAIMHHGAAVGTTGSFTAALTDGAVLMDALGVVLGAGALRIGRQVVSAARAGSSASAAGGAATRMVPQLVGPPIETAASFFQLARSASYQMGEGELIWRTARFQADAGGLAYQTVSAPGNLETIRRLVSWELGPLTRRPSVVT